MAFPKRISRRMVLRGATGIGLSLPYLEAMGPAHRAHAAPAGAVTKDGFPKRVIFMFTPNGSELDRWRPSGGGTNFTIASGSILNALNPHKANCVVIDGLDLQSRELQKVGGNAHDVGMAHLLVSRAMVPGPQGVGEFGHLWDGSAGGISLDQEIGNQLKGSTPFHSLQLGVRVNFNGQRLTNHLSWAGKDNPKACVSNPRDVFKALFANTPMGTGAAAQLERRRNLSDAVLDDYKKLHARLGTNDKRLLEQHLSSVTSINERVKAEPPATACAQPSFTDSNDFRQSALAQMDNVVAAFACDLTRVATFQWATSQGGQQFPWLSGVDGSHHGISHDDSPDGHNKMYAIQRWYAEQFATFIDKLKSVKEGNGTLADNTVLVWVQELSNGASHSHDNIPLVLAGSLGGTLKTGQYLSYPGTTSISNLWVSMLNAFGVDTKVFGDAAVCKGPVSGLLA